jgi:hypothetical protein
MQKTLRAVAIAVAMAASVSAANAQQDDGSVPAATAPTAMSTMLRNAGYTVSADEATYLDADEQATDQFVRAMLTTELHAPTINDDYSRQLVIAELRRVAALDPGAVTVAAPGPLAELNRLAVVRRAAIRETAQKWLEGLSTNDPNWVARGSDAYGVARQAEVDWYAAMRQIFVGRPAAPGQ